MSGEHPDPFAPLFVQLEQLLKSPDLSEELGKRGINTSLALTAAEGLHAYLRGEKSTAAEDLMTAAEEIESRLAAARHRGNGG